MSEAPFVKEDYRSFFQGLTGLVPFDYQLRVAEVLCSGRNIVFRAPTGAGKTWAVVAPFLWKWQCNAVHDRCIYALPLRSLAASIHENVRSACKLKWWGGTVSGHGGDREGEESRKPRITIQTGENQNDRYFEGDLVCTTIDQVLSSYLMIPVSLPQRLGNINAGALLGAYLVFDEFHLLEPSRALGTLLEMAERLSIFSQFIFMTATMSGKTLRWMAKNLGAEMISLKKEDVASLPSHREKRRTFRWVSKPLMAEAVWDAHKGHRTIAILNTVARAQALYSELKEMARGSETVLILLHSRFFNQDRAAKEAVLLRYFGKEAVSSDVILIATQVIEAGMDISADILHTELAPMNSLIQRAGRCARYEKPRGIGTVLIYDLERNKKGERKWGPYRDPPLRQIGESTGSVLEEFFSEEIVVDTSLELEWIDQVHGFREMEALTAFDPFQRRRMVNEAMEGHRKDAISSLVRDVFSVGVIVTGSPKTLHFGGGMLPRTVAVPRRSLYVLSKYFQGECGAEWIAKVPRKPAGEPEEDPGFDWVKVKSVEEAVYAPWLIALSPSVCSYSTEQGLLFGVKSEGDRSVEYDYSVPRTGYAMEYEPYHLHVERVLKQCGRMCSRHENALSKLEKVHQLDKGQAALLARLACALHDVGKLSRGWQGAMRKWQEFKDGSRLGTEAIAHTDYDPEMDRGVQKKFPNRGPHAAAGAFAVSGWLNEMAFPEAVAPTIWSAIARHHNPHTRELISFEFIEGAEGIVKETMPRRLAGTFRLEDRPNHVGRKMFRYDLVCFTRDEDYPLWALYVLITRILRLSDQKSMREI